MVSIAAGVWEGPGYAFRLRLCPFCGTTSFCATDRKRVMLGEACVDKQEPEVSNEDFGFAESMRFYGLYGAPKATILRSLGELAQGEAVQRCLNKKEPE